MNLSALREHLRKLERKGQLEKQLAKHVAMPWSELADLLQYPAWIGFAVCFVRTFLHHSEGAKTSDADAIWLLGLLFAALVLRFGHGWLRSPAERLRRRVRRKGLLVPAAIVQANTAFGAADNREWQPAALLIAFDPRVVQEPQRLLRAAGAVFALKHADRRQLPADRARIAWDLYHEMGPVRSLPVPADLAEGLQDCQLVSVMLPPQPLRVGDLCMVLTVPGERSHHAVAALPASLAP